MVSHPDATMNDWGVAGRVYDSFGGGLVGHTV